MTPNRCQVWNPGAETKTSYLPTGASVANVRPLSVSQPLFDYPNYGTVVGDDLVYFGNSHWASAPGERRAVRVLKTSLEAGEDTYDLEKEKYIDENIRKRKAQQKNNPGQAASGSTGQR